MSSRKQKISPTTEKTFSQIDSRGTAQRYAREDHTHGTPDNPTDTHVAETDPHDQYRLESENHSHEGSGIPGGQIDHGAAMVAASLLDDDHTQYRLESADHNHQSTGLQAGKIDHGLALDGLSDDDHTQYIKHSLATAVSDFLVASGVGVFVKKTLAEVQTILGLGTAAYTAATDYVTHALATAANDFLVASGSGAFVKKTLAEVKTILGLGSAAYTASTDYAIAAKGVTNGDTHDHVGGDGAQIDHGGLGGLADDDHTQYVMVDNSRMATGRYRYAAALADTGTITLPTVTANWPAHGFIHCAHASTGVISESAEFEFGSTGAVQIIRGTVNIEANGATAGKISLGPAVSANPVVIKNNLGGGVSVNVMVTLWYK